MSLHLTVQELQALQEGASARWVRIVSEAFRDSSSFQEADSWDVRRSGRANTSPKIGREGPHAALAEDTGEQLLPYNLPPPGGKMPTPQGKQQNEKIDISEEHTGDFKKLENCTK